MTPLSPDEARALAATCASVRKAAQAGTARVTPAAETWLDVAERGAAGVLALVAEVDTERARNAPLRRLVASLESSREVTRRIVSSTTGQGAAKTLSALDEARGDAATWNARATELEAERDALREALRFVCCVAEGCEFCGAIGTKVRDGSEWCDVCAPPDAVDHEHAATLRPLLPPRGAK